MSRIPGLEVLFAKDAVNLRNPQEVELWTEVLNIYTADLVTAVAAVGTSPQHVLDYLQQHAIPGVRDRAAGAAPKPEAD